MADDHPAILDAVSRFLEGESGFELAGRANDGEGALRLIDEHAPHIALLDIRMPGIGGIDIAAKLAAASSPVSVVLFTAYPERALLLAALDVGVRGFILKEAPLDELLRAIRIVAGGGSYIDASLASVLAGPATNDRMLTLTKRERDVLRLLSEGMRDEQAGRTLSISPLTVRTHVQHAMAKLKLRHAHAGRRRRAARVADRLSPGTPAGLTPCRALGGARRRRRRRCSRPGRARASARRRLRRSRPGRLLAGATSAAWSSLAKAAVTRGSNFVPVSLRISRTATCTGHGSL